MSFHNAFADAEAQPVPAGFLGTGAVDTEERLENVHNVGVWDPQPMVTYANDHALTVLYSRYLHRMTIRKRVLNCVLQEISQNDVHHLSIHVQKDVHGSRGQSDTRRPPLVAIRLLAQNGHKVTAFEFDPTAIAEPLQLQELAGHHFHFAQIGGEIGSVLVVRQEFQRHLHASEW